MVIWRDIFTSITIKFGALSLIFTVASTAGEYWIVVTFDGIRLMYGLWKSCIGRYEEKHCIQNHLAKGNKPINSSNSIRSK